MIHLTPTEHSIGRMKRERQEIVSLVPELAAAIEQRDWADVEHYCDRILDLVNGIRNDANRVARSLQSS